MLFHTFEFCAFLISLLAIYYSCPKSYRLYLLLISSYIFYAWENPKYLFIILYISLLNYALGALIEKHRFYSKLFILISLVGSLSILFLFKYLFFFTVNLNYILSWTEAPTLSLIKLILPAGISFYTFQAISYTIDVHRGQQAERNIFKFLLYISFFPQLVAGPIERSSHMLPQFEKFNFPESSEFHRGCRLILWGLLKKIFIADSMAPIANAVFSNPGSWSQTTTLIGIIAFAIQIYMDFSAYSDIAIGTAKLFGIHLSKNFLNPYFANSLHDFWKRWHISLSQWIRNYIYIPLGGSKSNSIHVYRNIIIAFVLSGLWHGAGWNFLIWGGMHGIVLCLEKSLNLRKTKSFFYQLLVLIFVIFAWVFFRSTNLEQAMLLFSNLTPLNVSISQNMTDCIDLFYSIGYGIPKIILLLTFIVLIFSIEQKNELISIQSLYESQPLLLRWAGYLFCSYLLLWTGFQDGFSFIYFKF